MKKFFSLRILLFVLAITGGVKFVEPLFKNANSGQQKKHAFIIVNSAFASETKPATEDGTPTKMKPQTCEQPEEIFLAIDKERDLLNAQKAKLEERKAGVNLAEAKLKQETHRLSTLKSDLEGLLARVEQAKSDDLKRLISIYSGMKPKEAANIMNTLDIEVTVMILGQMKERDAAPIFAKLNVVRSQAISKIILERSKLPGDQKLNGIVLQ